MQFSKEKTLTIVFCYRCRNFVKTSRTCVHKIVQEASTFISDGQIVLVHSYSRVVSQTLIHAAQTLRKRFSVYVTEARPFGLGVKTHSVLSKAGIPCTIILDSAVSYIMGKCSIVLLGAEGVCESGGLVNGIGSFGIALAAKAYDKPVYACAESFKFLRLYPLSQFDLPTSSKPLTFNELDDPTTAQRRDSVAARRDSSALPRNPSKLLRQSPWPRGLEMTLDQLENQPTLDYTSPDALTASESAAYLSNYGKAKRLSSHLGRWSPDAFCGSYSNRCKSYQKLMVMTGRRGYAVIYLRRRIEN